MAYFADLTPFTYGGAEPDPRVLNVGWLTSDVAIPTAPPAEPFATALKQIMATPINLYRGSHICDFCPPPPMILSEGGMRLLDPPAETRGNGEVWVRGLFGVTFVAPALLLHYVLEHHYAPPECFIDAVIAAG